jgi:hypothetical protein
MFGLGAAAAVAAAAMGCAAVLGVADVGYAATDAAAIDAAATTDARATDEDAAARDACTPVQALLFANFDQGSATTGYVDGNVDTIFKEVVFLGDSLDVDDDASVSPPGSLSARGGNAFVYREVPDPWLDGGLSFEGDFRVDTLVDAGTLTAELMALHFGGADAGFSDPRGSSASLSGEVKPTYVQLRLVVGGGDAGEVPLDVARTTLGAWFHARLRINPAAGGDFDVTLDVDGTPSQGSVRLRGNDVGYVGWGVNRKNFGEWRVRVDNACAHH